jgi:hypothetical protein
MLRTTGESAHEGRCAAAEERTHRQGTRRLYVSQSFLYLQSDEGCVSRLTSHLSINLSDFCEAKPGSSKQTTKTHFFAHASSSLVCLWTRRMPK